MDKFGRPTSGRLSPSLNEQHDSPPIRPRRAAPPPHPVTSEMLARFVIVPRGGSKSAYLRRVRVLADQPTPPRHLVLLPKLRLLPSPPREKPRLLDLVTGLVLKSEPPSMPSPPVTMTMTSPSTPTSVISPIQIPTIYLQGMSAEILFLYLLVQGRAGITPRPGRSRSFTRH